jgi:hypothetical protein
MKVLSIKKLKKKKLIFQKKKEIYSIIRSSFIIGFSIYFQLILKISYKKIIYLFFFKIFILFFFFLFFSFFLFFFINNIYRKKKIKINKFFLDSKNYLIN